MIVIVWGSCLLLFVCHVCCCVGGCVCYVGFAFVIVWGMCLLLSGGCICYYVGVVFVIVCRICLLLCGGCVCYCVGGCVCYCVGDVFVIVIFVWLVKFNNVVWDDFGLRLELRLVLFVSIWDWCIV